MSTNEPPSEDLQADSHGVQISRSAERCFELFCTVERTPEWLPGCRRARVRHYDGGGLPLVADYMAGAARGGYLYAMHYEHDPAALAVSWESEDPTGTRKVKGSARFLATGPGSCRLLYETRVELSDRLPAWARAAQLDHPAAEICEKFKAWVEREP
ncbi:MAG: SRPBCC family protein [Polyangia bacterium]|jgi:ribosome-associated toxin RatA of RatAB toxin-antitoxin module|nr:SRPBCC family protein [Polyangia bacterium]